MINGLKVIKLQNLDDKENERKMTRRLITESEVTETLMYWSGDNEFNTKAEVWDLPAITEQKK